jgi:uncharacterized membrane protein
LNGHTGQVNNTPTPGVISMSNSPFKFIVASFPDTDAAAKELSYLQEGNRSTMLDLKDAAVIRKDEHGKIHVFETADSSGRKGAAIGGAVGAVLGLLSGPGAVIAGAAGAAVVGGLAARLHDAGISNKALKEFGETLQPGASALILILGEQWVEQISKDLTAAGGNVLTDSLDAGLAAQIEQDIQDNFKADKSPTEAQVIGAKVQDARYKEDIDIQSDEARPMVQ